MNPRSLFSKAEVGYSTKKKVELFNFLVSLKKLKETNSKTLSLFVFFKPAVLMM